MPKFHLKSQNSEATGGSLLATIHSVERETIEPIVQKRLAQYGIKELEPTTWYPFQLWIDIENDLDDLGGLVDISFVSIGMKVIETAQLPPDVEKMSLPEILQMWDAIYKMNVRGEEIGGFACEIVGPKHIKMIKTNPMPDDHEYGVFYGTALRFLPKGTQFTVEYDEELPRMDDGADCTVYHITWD